MIDSGCDCLGNDRCDGEASEQILRRVNDGAWGLETCFGIASRRTATDCATEGARREIEIAMAWWAGEIDKRSSKAMEEPGRGEMLGEMKAQLQSDFDAKMPRPSKG